MRRAIEMIVVGLVLFCTGGISFGQQVDSDTCKAAMDAAGQPVPRVLVGNLCLTQTSVQIAKVVCFEKNCVKALVDELGEMSVDDRCKPGEAAIKALLLRQNIAEAVMTASLQVDGFVAEIDSETSQIRAVHDGLTDRRDTAVNRSTLGSAIGTGGGAVGSALALAGTTAVTAGSWVGAAFGAVGAVFGFWGVIQAKGPTGCFPDLREDTKKKEKTCLRTGPDEDSCLVAGSGTARHSSGCTPRMLYQLFNPLAPVQFHSAYDETVENYLNGQRPGEEQTRREILKATWEPEDRKPLFAGNAAPEKLSIDQLTDRADKLADLRAVVARMNRDLSRLTLDLATALRCQQPSR